MMLWSVSINTFKFNSDVKIISMQRKIANGEIILKINEQQTNVIKFKRKISIFEHILWINDLRQSKLGKINQMNVLKKESEENKNKTNKAYFKHWMRKEYLNSTWILNLYRLNCLVV